MSLVYIGEKMPSGMIKLFDPDISFREDFAESAKRRYRHSASDSVYLASKGLITVKSSNVSALGVFGDDLYIRFLNGSVYRYPNNAKLFEVIMQSLSKGKAVWRHIRRAGIDYEKVGYLPIPEEKGFKGLEQPEMADYNDLHNFKEISKLLGIKELSGKELLPLISLFKTLN